VRGVFVLLVCGCGRIAFDPVDSNGTQVRCAGLTAAPRAVQNVITLGDTNNEWPNGFARDRQGGLTLTGSYDVQTSFGGSSTPSAGGADIFVVAVTEQGTHRWSHTYGGTMNDWGSRLVIDSQGRVDVVGRFEATASFDMGPVTSNGDSDIVLLQYDAGGNVSWAHEFGSIGWDDAYELALDASDNIYIAGTIHGTVDYGGGALTSAGQQPDALIASFTPTGIHRWSRKFGAAIDWDEAQGIVVVGDVVYVIGNFVGTVDFGVAVLTASGTWDMFALSLDAATGAPRWARSFGDAGGETPLALAYAAGTLFIAGQFNGTTDLGDGPQASVGGYDGFMLALSDAGDVLWSRVFGASMDDYTWAVSANECRVAFGGTTYGPVDLGLGTMSALVGVRNGFLAEYRHDGTPLWTHALGVIGPAGVSDVVLDGQDDLWATGGMTDTADLGGGPLTTRGGDDLWAARFAR
jgi:hypothetical protein